MKILYVTTNGGTFGFFKSIIADLINEGNKVDIACNLTSELPSFYKEIGCEVYPIDCIRKPLTKKNIKCICQIRNIVAKGEYNIVHCHTPVASFCTRIACRKFRRNGVKVVYTAHGFHFFKGASLKNWVLYYPIEKMCSHWTDHLITINSEDYELACKKFRRTRVWHIPGVGIKLDRFKNVQCDVAQKRKDLDIPTDAFVLLSVGELNHNKNHSTVIRAIAKLDNKKIHYVIAGVGDKKQDLIMLASECGLGKNLHLLGYRNDVHELYKMADVYILPSIREGLNVSVMEAMACGKPCIVSDIRGNRDLVDEKGGYLCSTMCIDEYSEAILKTMNSPLEHYSNYNAEKSGQFSSDVINKQIFEVYFGKKLK